MKLEEKVALLQYLEEQLTALCVALEPHLDPDAVGTMYDQAYELISDMEDTIEGHIELETAERQALSSKK
jgi:hypothetical protein